MHKCQGSAAAADPVEQESVPVPTPADEPSATEESSALAAPGAAAPASKEPANSNEV